MASTPAQRPKHQLLSSLLDGQTVELGATKQRALLALLLIHSNRVVSIDRLVDDLWGSEAPARATNAVQVYVSALRRVLEPDRPTRGTPGVLLTRPPGYLLRVSPRQLDLLRFESLVEQGRQSMEAGDAATGRAAFAEALSLWRGPALADFAYEPFAEREAARLEELHLRATEERVEADLAVGRHADVVGELEGLVGDEPLRERLTAQLMLALYRCGRQAEALRAYQRLRGVLGEELGIEPSAALQTLEEAMLLQKPELDWVSQNGASRLDDPLPTGVVTFLLTDIESSSSLWESHPEAMAEALTRHDALATRVVAERGGQVIKAKGEGDATLSVFTRASDGVRAALELQNAIAVEEWPDGIDMRVRMALHTGEAHERDGDYYGPTVNRAARLRSLASGGQTLVSQATAEVVWEHLPQGTNLADLGRHELRGLSRGEQVFELCAAVVERVEPVVEAIEPAAPMAIPLPASLVVPADPIVSRDDELARLQDAWKRAGAGERQLVLVAGEPGIGKTRLVSELARWAHGEGATVLYGRCDQDLRFPYQLFAEALGQYIANGPQDVVEPCLRKHGDELARLVPQLAREMASGPSAPASDPETERYRMFEAAVSLLADASARTPVVLLLDDLHWADTPALVLLKHLLISRPEMRLLVLGTYRDSELSPAHPLQDLLAQLHGRPGVERLTLEGLDDGGVRALMEGAAGHDLDEAGAALAHELREETDGNPFFVGEILRNLAESGDILRVEGRWVASAGATLTIPQSVREVIDHRVRRLGEPANGALAMAAVIGPQFDLDVLRATVASGEDELLAAFDKAVAAALVTESTDVPGRFQFAHALIQHTLYEALTPSRRQRAHRSVAEAFERLPSAEPLLPELAYHWSRGAKQGDIPRALDYARRAGDAALRQLAPDEAARWYEQALKLQERIPDESLRCELLIRLGDAQRRAGDPDYRATLLEGAELAQELGDGARLVRAALTNSRRQTASAVRQVDLDRVRVLEAALQAAGTEDSASRALLLATLGVELLYAPDRHRRVRLSDDALAMARRVGDQACLAEVLSVRGQTIAAPETLDERIANSHEQLALAQQLGDRALYWLACINRAYVCAENIDRDGALAAMERAQELAHEVAQPYMVWVTAIYRAGAAIIGGRLGEAEALALDALQLGSDSGQPDAALVFGVQLFCIRWAQGRLDELEEAMAENVGQEGPSVIRAFVALVHCELGHFPEARAIFDADARSDFELPLDPGWLPGMSAYAHVCARLGDRDRAAVLQLRLAPWTERVCAGGFWAGPVAHYLGELAVLLGHHDEGQRHFAVAIEASARLGAQWSLAWAQCEWANMLLDQGTPDDARRACELAGQALAVAEELGFGRVAEQARSLLEAASQPALPSALQIGDERGSRLCGRERELEELTAGWAQAAAGEGRLALVTGEPGIGKTRLVAEVAAAAHAQGATVLFGRCHEGDWARPYGPFAEAVDDYARTEPPELEAEPGPAAALIRVAPVFGEVLPDLVAPEVLEPDEERVRIFDAVAQLLIGISRRSPCC